MGSDFNYVALILSAVDQGKFRLGFNLWKVNAPGSPVYKPWEAGVPGLILTAAVAWNFYYGGLVFGIVSFVCALLFFVIFVRRWTIARVENRLVEYMKGKPYYFRDLWKAGDLSLWHVASGERAYGPKDDFRQFAHKHLLKTTIE